MKVILYYPPVTPVTHFPTWEPLQLLFLARYLRGMGIDVEILDGRLWSEEEKYTLIAEKLTGNVVCFGITSLTCYQLLDALAVAEHVKKQQPDLPVLFGGWHATIFPEETLKEKGVDIVIRGQGEVTLGEVIERLGKSRDLSGIEGISWKRGDQIIHEAGRPLTPPDHLPLLLPSDFEKLDLEHYQVKEKLFYMAGVGCPYSCKYCCVGFSCRRKWFPLSAQRVIQEIEGLHDRFGFQEIIFWDNVFFTDRKRVSEVCEGLRMMPHPIAWSAHGRINEIATWDDDFMRLLRESGCKSVYIGAESGSQRILDSINKNIRAGDIIPALKKLRNHDINAATNWMVGLPGEGRRDVLLTMRAIKEGLKVYDYDHERFKVHLYRFVPFPGTAIFEGLPKEVRDMLPKTARGWGDYIHSKINDGMEPWKESRGTFKFAPMTFYLWKAFLEQKADRGLKARVLQKMAKLRIGTGFTAFPLEWWIWKRGLKKS